MSPHKLENLPAERSEILFCYDVRMANPNGDPDENRPRIDQATGKNLVTDFRLKRTIRDYLKNQLGEKIFIRAEQNKVGKLKIIEELAEPYIKGKKKDKVINRDALLRDHIDIRLFGILFAVEDITFKQIGPVQFAIGQSIHPVEEETVRITRIVPTRAEVKAGTFGEKSILRYSFIAFRGFVNDFVAREVNLTENDIDAMLNAMWFGTNDLTTTSKFGQQSRLLLKICYREPRTYIGDLDRYISIEKADVERSKLENISQFTLKTDDLFNVLTKNVKKIKSIYHASHEDLQCSLNGNIATFSKHLMKWFEEVGKPNNVKLADILKQHQ